MTQEELKKLERSLARSAMTAKPFYVRGMTGLTETEQGFFPIGIAPVFNPFTGEQSQLETVFNRFYREQRITKEDLDSLTKRVNETKEDLDEVKQIIVELKEFLTKYTTSQDSTDKLIIQAVEIISAKVGTVEAEVNELKGMVQ